MAAPILKYLKKEVDSDQLKERIQRSIILVLNTRAPIKNENESMLASRKELLLLYIKKIFLGFESPQELKAVLNHGQEIARNLKLPANQAFLNASHYRCFIKQYYSPLSFRQKLENTLSMFSPERLARDYGIKLPTKTPTELSEILKITVIMGSVIDQSVSRIFCRT